MNRPILIPLDNKSDPIQIKSDEFTMGRGLTNNFTFKELCISRCHCVFKYDGTSWNITDKSSNGTVVNSNVLTKNSSCTVADNDIITFSDTMKYRFQFSPESIVQYSNKRKRIDNNTHEHGVTKRPRTFSENTNQNCDAQTPVDIKEISNIGSNSGVSSLSDELKREKAISKTLKDESLTMLEKVMTLQVDLCNKIATNVSLEQENAELKVNCATLEKEKEDLQLQLLDYESQTSVLKCRLQNSHTTDGCVRSSDDTDAADEEDKKLLGCVLRAEIFEKECTFKSKINNVIIRLKQLTEKHVDENIGIIQEHVQELQGHLDDLIVKHNELECTTSPATAVADNNNTVDKVKEQLFELMESELQCSICNEVYVKATTLNCNHTFCKTCIMRWRKQKNSCPICRIQITASTQCIAVDNYIDHTVDKMSQSKKELRSKLKETYEASASGPSTTTTTTNGQGGARTIYISSAESDSETDIDSEDYSDNSENEVFWGGYGACYICGQSDHWANGCPRRRR